MALEMFTDAIDGSRSAVTTTGPLKIREACPGAEYLFQQNYTDRTFLHVNVSKCPDYEWPQFLADQGVIYGVCGGSTIYCNLHVKVKKGMYLRAQVRRLTYRCGLIDWKMRIILDITTANEVRVECDVHSLEDMLIHSYANSMWIESLASPMTAADFQTMKSETLVMHYTTKYSGYMVVPYVASYTPFREKLEMDHNCLIMVSVLQSYSLESCPERSNAKVIYRERNTSGEYTAHMCTERSAPASLFVTSTITFQFYHDDFRLNFLKIGFCGLCDSDHPQRVPNGLFNCSVNYYFKFQKFLHCNLKTECEDGQDETEQCPFSGPGCQGMVASRNKCFKEAVFDTYLSYKYVDYTCRKIGRRIASVKTRQELENNLHIFRNYFLFLITLGYTSGWYSVPFTYSRLRHWSDKTIIYNLNHFRHSKFKPSRKRKYGYWSEHGLHERPISSSRGDRVLCEMESQLLSKFTSQAVFRNLQLPLPSYRNTQQSLLICTDSPVTHTFLHCDPSSHCGNASYSQSFAVLSVNDERNTRLASFSRHVKCTNPMFSCDDDLTSVHYTLICDLRQDCPDDSDESFCEHPPCDGFLCCNGQCVLHRQRCNEHSDCLDDSDEVNCWQQSTSCAYCTPTTDVRKDHQCHINLDGTGYFTQQVMKVDEPCADTHYRCTSERLYCLPVYTRCNGFSDCVYGEDEQDCDNVQCLGLYHCQASSICVHEDHLCDGWGQCPRWDDELLCDMTCPEKCLCQGHSFQCKSSFPADLFSQLRYLDATGSGMSLRDFSANTYLTFLVLSSCSVSNISAFKLPNLQVLDLTNNALTSLDMSAFQQLSNLRVLRLARNPVRPLTVHRLPKRIYYSLMKLDISQTNLHVLHNELFGYLPMIIYFNVSLSVIKVIGSVGLKNMPRLIEIDTRFNPVEEFPLDLFSGSHHLRKIHTSNHRFCCGNVLPEQSGEIKCLAPHTVLPSCTKLIPSALYRGFFWMVSLCATLGCLCCSVSVLRFREGFEGSLIMIVNLLFSKSCTGCHVTIIAVANEVFGIRYIHLEKTWTHSMCCKMAGFLLYLSCETSVLFLGFITMQHFIVICCSKDTWKIKQGSLTTVCVVVWCLGAVLSLIPFLPGLSHWGLHGQSGLCRLALFDRYDSDQHFRWLNVVVAVNAMICLAIMVGQLVIYRRTPKFRVILDPTRRSVYSSVHLTRTMATMDIATWLSFGFVLIMATSDVPAFYQILEALVVFMFPLSAAFDPFLYVLTLIMQQRQQVLEEKVIKMLKARLVSFEKQGK